MICLLLCLVCALSACGSPSPTPHVTTATPNAMATVAAQPVLFELNASSSGTVAADTLQLTITATVINHTGQTIRIAYHSDLDCIPTPFMLSLLNSSGKTVWTENESFAVNGCVPMGYYDLGGLPFIPPGGSWHQVRTISLRYVLQHGIVTLTPGTYMLAGTELFWHEGKINRDGTSSSPHGFASGQTTVTLQ